jgi:protein ImuB
MLWLAIHLPHLALDSIALAGNDEAAPFAVYENGGHRDRIHARNRAAAHAGVALGMPVSAALALHGTLTLRPRDAEVEQTALDGLAAWAMQFSDRISVQPPDGLLIEIGGSLLLFGGLEVLRQRIATGLLEMGYHGRFGIAPTTLAAWWLAQVRAEKAVLDTALLGAALSPLSLDVLDLPEDALARLRGLGVVTVGDCLQLPRAGLAKRFGASLLDALDRALGKRPDPRPHFESPERFARTLWLPSEVTHTDALLFAARRLLLELAGFLRGRGAGTRSFTVRMLRNHAAAETLALNLVTPSRDPGHLLTLLRERFARHVLKAPVHGITIETDAFESLAHTDHELFASNEKHQPKNWQPLVETLRARLGNEAVHGMELTADHRPEHAWSVCPPGEAHDLPPTSAPRPTWLLEKTQPAPAHLAIINGPERIASGWWAENRPPEDYFVVATEEGERYWACVREGEVHIIGLF